MTRPALRDAAERRRRAATCVLGLTLALPLSGHATFPRVAPLLPNDAAVEWAVVEPAPRAGDGLRTRRDAAYYRASVGYCRQLHGRVRALCFDEAAKLYAR